MNPNSIVNTKGGIEATMTFSITCQICHKMKTSSAKKYFDHPMLFWNDMKKLDWNRFEHGVRTTKDSPYKYTCSSVCSEKHIAKHLNKMITCAYVYYGQSDRTRKSRIYVDMHKAADFAESMFMKHNYVEMHKNRHEIRILLQSAFDAKDLLESLG